MITVQLTSKRHIAAATAAYLASIPTTNPPTTVGTGGSVQGFVQAAIEQYADQLRDSHAPDRISTAEFLMRFTAPEFDALKTAAVSDPIASGLLARLSAEPNVWLGSDEVQQGIGYLVAAGLLTAERGAAVLHYDVPSVP
jgi:phytoene dehydrogenase-like protein